MSYLRKIKKYYRTAYLLGNYPTLLSLLTEKKRILAYYGYIEDQNFGDKLVYDSAKLVFDEFILLPIRKIMPIELILFTKLFRNRFSGIIIGGGTIIRGPLRSKQYLNKILKDNKPVFVHGTGVDSQIEDLNGWKPFLNSNYFGGVRGQLSVESLRERDIWSKVIGDAAISHYETTSKKLSNEKKYILINIGTHSEYLESQKSREHFKEAIKTFLKLGFDIKFLPFHKIDVELADQLKSKMPEINVLNIPSNYSECISYFHDAEFAIGERLHFVIMSILGNCPVLSMSYDRKHNDFFESIENSSLSISLKDMHYEHILSVFHDRYDMDWKSVNQKLKVLKEAQFVEAERFKSAISFR